MAMAMASRFGCHTRLRLCRFPSRTPALPLPLPCRRQVRDPLLHSRLHWPQHQRGVLGRPLRCARRRLCCHWVAVAAVAWGVVSGIGCQSLLYRVDGACADEVAAARHPCVHRGSMACKACVSVYDQPKAATQPRLSRLPSSSAACLQQYHLHLLHPLHTRHRKSAPPCQPSPRQSILQHTLHRSVVLRRAAEAQAVVRAAVQQQRLLCRPGRQREEARGEMRQHNNAARYATLSSGTSHARLCPLQPPQPSLAVSPHTATNTQPPHSHNRSHQPHSHHQQSHRHRSLGHLQHT
jgi:hypothetical protein